MQTIGRGDGARRGAHPRRVASSVWLPWAVSGFLLLSLATGALVAGGRGEQHVRVPTAALEGQQSVTSTAARAVRRNLNEGVRDLRQLAADLSHQRVTDAAALRPHLAGLDKLHGRFLSLYGADQRGSVITQVGSGAHPGVLPSGITGPGAARSVDTPGRMVIALYVPLARPRGADWVLAGEYDPASLRSALTGTRPGSAWIVDDDGRVLDPAPGTASYRPPDRPILRHAAARAGDEAGYELAGDSAAPHVVAWASVAGSGPAGSLGLGVVSARTLDQDVLPQAQARPQTLAFGLLLLTTVLVTFGWLYAMLVRPLRRLGLEAERLAYGDLRQPVEIRRYDEIGLIGHSLERVRLVLLRRIDRDEADARLASEVR